VTEALGWAPFLAVLLSAALHPSWNAWVKAGADPTNALAAIVIGAGAPGLATLAITGLPALAAWPWLTGAVAANIVALVLSGRAYAEGHFAVAYPMVRGLVPLVLALAAVPLFGERLGPVRLLGVVAVSAGIAVLAWEAARRSKTMSAAGLGFAALAAILTATYVLFDAKAARASDNPVAYAAALTVANAAVMAALHRLRGRDVIRLIADHWPIATIGPIASFTSYALFIWALTQAPVALVAALRETSGPMAVLIGVLVLHERAGAWRWGAVALVAAGAALIRW
jgi:multidrug transporter EmrE-like cation transporter